MTTATIDTLFEYCQLLNSNSSNRQRRLFSASARIIATVVCEQIVCTGNDKNWNTSPVTVLGSSALPIIIHRIACVLNKLDSLRYNESISGYGIQTRRADKHTQLCKYFQNKIVMLVAPPLVGRVYTAAIREQ